MKLFKSIFNFIFGLFDSIFFLLSILLFIGLIFAIGRNISNDTINIIHVSWIVLFLNWIFFGAGIHIKRAGIEMENNNLKSAGTLIIWSQILVSVIVITILVYQYWL